MTYARPKHTERAARIAAARRIGAETGAPWVVDPPSRTCAAWHVRSTVTGHAIRALRGVALRQEHAEAIARWFTAQQVTPRDARGPAARLAVACIWLGCDPSSPLPDAYALAGAQKPAPAEQPVEAPPVFVRAVEPVPATATEAAEVFRCAALSARLSGATCGVMHRGAVRKAEHAAAARKRAGGPNTGRTLDEMGACVRCEAGAARAELLGVGEPRRWNPSAKRRPDYRELPVPRIAFGWGQ
jgi:hypothetical protein